MQIHENDIIREGIQQAMKEAQDYIKKYICTDEPVQRGIAK